jgi:CheY-like chemotaxis protein
VTGPSKNILLVDDENVVREACSELLQRNGFSVDTAINGEDALGKLKLKAYDLIILDINMPRIDGIDFYKRVKHEYPMLKERILFITGDLSGEIDALTTFLNIETNVLKKPFTKLKFLEAVNNAIAGQ